MVTKSFQHTYLVGASIAKVYNHLADPHSYMGLSPLLVSLTGIQWGTNPQNQRFVRYQSVELFRFLGVISYRNPLDATMSLTQPPQQIITDVQTRQNVTVRFVFDLQEEPNGTHVTETITAHVPAWLGGFVVNQAKYVQQNRIKVLKQRMETPNQKGE